MDFPPLRAIRFVEVRLTIGLMAAPRPMAVPKRSLRRLRYERSRSKHQPTGLFRRSIAADGRSVAEGMAEVSNAPDVQSPLPAGTVTFLLSDIEGSTSSWEAEPEAMARAVPLHYTMLADAVASHGGVRPVEQGEGDSIVAAFARASDAVAAALDAQRALHAQRWPGELDLKVRLALHTADAQLRDGGNYAGAELVEPRACGRSRMAARRWCHRPRAT